MNICCAHTLCDSVVGGQAKVRRLLPTRSRGSGEFGCRCVCSRHFLPLSIIRKFKIDGSCRIGQVSPMASTSARYHLLIPRKQIVHDSLFVRGMDYRRFILALTTRECHASSNAMPSAICMTHRQPSVRPALCCFGLQSIVVQTLALEYRANGHICFWRQI